MLLQRILTGAVLIAVVLLVLFWGPPWVFFLAMAPFGLLALWEYLELVARTGSAPPRWPVYAAALGVWAVAAWFPRHLMPAVIGGVLVLFLSALGRRQAAEVLPASAASAFALLYIGVPFAFLLDLFAWHGYRIVLCLFLLVWAGDTAAYFVGRALGRHKLAPVLSPGKTVDLRLLHGGMSKRRDVTVQRGRYDAPDPTMREYGDVAYVRIPYFEDGTAAKFASVVAKAGASGKKKLIVDVRDNAGGSLDEAIAAADSLLSKGLITAWSGRRVEPQQWQADAETVYDGEVQVLVDGSSAGTAEIFAAAISGNKRGKATGLPTFGYAVSQKLVPLTSGGALYVTVGHFTTPDRKPITEQGFRPDNMVDMTPLAVKKEEEQERARDEYILQEALELFGQKQAKTAA